MLSFVLRHALALIFVVSAIAKLADRAGTAEAVRNFALPTSLVRPIAALLPVAELLVAGLLVVDATARLGGGAALLLLLAFIAVVGWSLSQGRRPECNCFGKIGGSDISGRTIVRNVALAAGAAVVIASGTDTPSDWGLGLAIAAAAAAAVLAAEGAAGKGAVRRKQAALDAAFDEAMDGEVGFERVAAPDFALEDAGGAVRTLADLLDGRRPLLACFLSPGCGPCVAFKPSVTRWGQVYDDQLQLVAISPGNRHDDAGFVEELSPVPVLFDAGEVRVAYGIDGTPGAVLVGADGRLAGPPAVGEVNIRKLLGAALTGTEVQLGETVPQGEPADSLDLAAAPEPRPTVTVHREEDGGVFLIDEASGATASLNDIGAIVWECLDGEGRLDEIAADLADAFSAPLDVVTADVLTFVREVGRAGLLVGISPELPEAEAVEEGMANA